MVRAQLRLFCKVHLVSLVAGARSKGHSYLHTTTFCSFEEARSRWKAA